MRALLFRDRGQNSLDAGGNIIRFDKKMSAALIKQLSSNPPKYVVLVQAGYKPDRIPGWVARPDPKTIA
jgi:hypothetical protein